MPEFSKHLLTIVTFLPLAGAILLLFFPRPRDEEDAHGAAHGHAEGAGESTDGARSSAAANAVRWFTFLVTVVTFALSVVLAAFFVPGRSGYQLEDGPYVWIQAFNVHYHLGIDGIGLLLILLTTFLGMLAALYSFSIKQRIKEYMIMLLVLQSAMTGVFCALDLVLFYVFWEASLVPMYFLIGIWGHERRIYAAIKFFLFTFAGSILMLVAIVFVYSQTGSFSQVALSDPANPAFRALQMAGPKTLAWVYAAFALAFMIKVPMFPFHTWLPDAHVEAPAAGSVILAGIMLKMGVYGFLRFCLPLFPVQAVGSAPIFITLAVIGIIYGAWVATMQPDMKKVIAYSSVSHLGFVMLGIFSFNQLGYTGAVLQSVNHGISTGMLFFLVGMLYDRRHTREIAAYGGVKRAVPVLAAFFLVALFSSVALPLTNGFIGEYTILQGSYLSPHTGWAATVLATTGMIWSSVYMLWLFQRVFTGPLDKEPNRMMPDLNWRDKLVLAPLVVMIFWLGCYVTTWTTYLNTSLHDLEAYINGNTGTGVGISAQGPRAPATGFDVARAPRP